MKKVLNTSVLGLLGGALLLSGCAVDKMPSGSGSEISSLSVQLPKEIEWTQSKKKSTGEAGGMIQEWVIKGFDSNSTPARVIYQKIVPAMPGDQLMTQVLKPFKSACKDVKLTAVPLNSKHANKMSNELICSQLGKNPVGLVAYTSVLTDKTANHLVIGEVRTLPSKKAGVFDIQNEQQQKQAQTSAAIAQLMQQMTANIKACDANNKCQ